MAFSGESFRNFFSDAAEKEHVTRLCSQRPDLTLDQAKCFVRLWAYALFRRRDDAGAPSSTIYLEPVEDFFACTNADACDLFYFDREFSSTNLQLEGSPRSASQRISKLQEKALLTTRLVAKNARQIRLYIKGNYLVPQVDDSEIVVDDFDPRRDAVKVASLLGQMFAQAASDESTEMPAMGVNYRVLREWYAQYPNSSRVLRRVSDGNPVGFYVFFPTHKDSEVFFWQHSPSELVYLTNPNIADPIKCAQPGDLECQGVFLRSWWISRPYFNRRLALKFLLDSQQTLQRMKQDFPNLMDLHTIALNPQLEHFGMVLGFQPGFQYERSDPTTRRRWLVIALDEFLELDLKDKMQQVTFLPD